VRGSYDNGEDGWGIKVWLKRFSHQLTYDLLAADTIYKSSGRKGTSRLRTPRRGFGGEQMLICDPG
jgi:hypothetical protein